MKKPLFCLILLAGIIVVPFSVSAHSAPKDHGVEAILHIDPGDSPIVGAPAYMHFDFSSNKPKVNFADCECMFTISNQGKVIYGNNFTDPQLKINELGFEYTYTFPAKGIYTFIIHNTSSSSTAGFMLSYDIRVDLENNTLKPQIDRESERTLAYLACRSAIKAGDPLSKEERKRLIEKLMEMKTPYTCPHGRPTHIELSDRELDKMFKRH